MSTQRRYREACIDKQIIYFLDFNNFWVDSV